MGKKGHPIVEIGVVLGGVGLKMGGVLGGCSGCKNIPATRYTSRLVSQSVSLPDTGVLLVRPYLVSI